MSLVGGQFLSFLLITLAYADIEKYSVFPEKAQVKAGEGLTLSLLPANDPLQTCNVTFQGKTVDLANENSLQKSLGVEYWGRSLEDGDCGVHVIAYNASIHSDKWVFKATAADNILRMASAEPKTADEWETNANLTIVADLGKSLSIPCAKENVLYCSLRDPTGAIVSKGANCTTRLQMVTMADHGLWKCTFACTNTVLEESSYLNISVISSRSFDLGKIDSETSVAIYCNSLMKEIDYCRLERPDGTAFIMADGRIVDRYSYFGQGIIMNDCGLIIRKPLQPVDIGTWVCSFGLKDGTENGGFITIQGAKDISKSASQMFLSPDNPQNFLNNSPLILTCSAKAPLDYCWFEHPNGSRFHPHPSYNASSWYYHGDGLDLGQCGITIAVGNISDSGTWKCGMGVRDEADISQDFQTSFQVNVVETVLVETDSRITASPGGQTVLKCRSLQGQALQYCSYTAPNGTTYNLTPRPEKSANTRLTYTGRGLENGDCGLLIKNVDSRDYGVWQCRAMLVASQDGVELHRNVEIVYPSLFSASAVGGIVAGVVVLSGMCAYFIYGRVRNNRRARNLRPVAFSVDSDEGAEIQIHPPAPANLEVA